MTHSYGLRACTRRKFGMGFRRHGAVRISKYLTTYRRGLKNHVNSFQGDYVDIVVDGSQHKGMPYQIYHGQTGRVFNVNPRSVGVLLKKQVNTRYVEKRLHVRVEHLRLSKSRADFVKRVQESDKKKQEANKAKQRISTKRIPVQPREAAFYKPATVIFQNPKQFVEIV